MARKTLGKINSLTPAFSYFSTKGKFCPGGPINVLTIPQLFFILTIR